MTKEERKKPSSIDFSRRKRIAAGSGAKQEEVGALVKQFDMVSKMTKQMAALTTNERVKAVKDLGDPAAAMAAMRNMPGLMGGRGSTHTASIKDRFKKRKK
jgi:signal recognition particle subunit SRP54